MFGANESPLERQKARAHRISETTKTQAALEVAWGSGTAYRGTSLRITPPPPWDPTVGLFLGSFGSSRGGGLFLVSEVPLQMLW